MLNYLVQKDLNRFAIRMGKLVAHVSRFTLSGKQSVRECLDSAPVLWEGSTPFVSPTDFSEGVRAFVEKRQPTFTRQLPKNNPLCHNEEKTPHKDCCGQFFSCSN